MVISGDRHQNDRLGSPSWPLTGAILPTPCPPLTISARLVAARFGDLVTCCRTGASADWPVPSRINGWHYMARNWLVLVVNR